MSQFQNVWLEPLLRFLKARVHDASFDRGVKYAHEGRVRGFAVDDDGKAIIAKVAGTRMYETVVEVLGKGKRAELDCYCSCPVEYDCKHGVAVAVALLKHAESLGVGEAARVKAYLPMRLMHGWLALPKGQAMELAGLFGVAAPAAPGQKTSDKRQAPGAVPQRAAAKLPPWERLASTDNPQDQRKILMEWIKSQMNPRPMDWDLEPVVRRLLELGDSISILHALAERWNNLIHSYYYGRPKPLPQEFQDFLRRPDIIARYDELRRRQAESALLDWLAGPGRREPAFNATEARIDILWTGIPYIHGIKRLAFEFLLTTPRLDRSPRAGHQIEGLIRELDQAKRIMPPGDEALARWIYARSIPPGLQHDRIPPSHSQTVLPVADATLWINRWDGIRTFHWDDGAPVLFSAFPMRLGINGDAGNSWCLDYIDGPEGHAERIAVDGAEIYCDSVSIQHMIDEPAHLMCRHKGLLHRIDAGGMPLGVFMAAVFLKAAPVGRLREAGLVRKLAAKLNPSLHELRQKTAPPASLVTEVPVRPKLELRLMEGNTLGIRMLAEGGDGLRFHKAANGDWLPARAPASSEPSGDDLMMPAGLDLHSAGEYIETEPPPGDWRELGESLPAAAVEPSTLAVVPMREQVAAIEDWVADSIMGEIDMVQIDGVTEIQWTFSKTDMAAFIEAWQRRPAEVDYLGDAAFRRLVEVQAAPRLNVKAEPSGMNWLAVSVEFEEELGSISLDDMRRAISGSTGGLVRLGNGRTYRREDLAEFEKQLDLLNDLGLEMTSGPQRLHALQAAGASKALLSGQEDLQELQALADRVRELVRDFKGVPEVRAGEVAEGYLRPYQREGVNFLAWAARNFGGALLADDMGLGKTLQILATLSALRAEGETGPSIVFCPASVSHNWQREAEKFTPDLRVLVLERGAGRKELMGRLADHDLIVINYALARREAPVLADIEWMAAVCDEAQAIKNPGADTARLVKQLKARYRFALTGTPIENRAGDLFSIMEFAAPGYLRPDAALNSRTNEDAARAAFRKLRARLRPVLLRRLKSEVATDLPERIEERIDCTMTEPQRKAYLAEVKRTREMLGGMKTTDLHGKERIQILAAITRLRQICCDPALVHVEGTGSGKTEELMNLVGPLLEAGHKVLIFSQFVRMLERIQTRLEDAGIPHYKLTGATGNRGGLVREFESDKRPVVFLISLKAGGTGLNLVSASHVILFDPWWNPAVEAQAIDRTHRIGQDKTVVAFRLVTRGTIEERILELQAKKMNIVRNVLEEDAFNRTLSREDFEYLLNEPGA